MSSYYYLAASMPMLTDSLQSPPLSSGDMLDQCRRFMHEDDYRVLLRADLNPDEPPREESDSSGGLMSIGDRFRVWERSLRNDLARLRCAEQNQDTETFTRDSEAAFGTAEAAAEAMACTTPLEAELSLNRRRWMKADELGAGHLFDAEFLAAYRLKLLLQERHAMFEEERGFAAYRRIYSRVLAAS